MRASILTVSDRSARGERSDQTGPALSQVLQGKGWQLVHAQVVPDEPAAIEDILRTWADSGETDLILTAGGTGLAPRDRTPEATLAVCDRMVPGLGEAMRQSGRQKTPHAMLSRAVAGTRGRTLIVNLPGSPTGSTESLDVILPALDHAVRLLRDDPNAEAGHTPKPR
ncbi:MAG TPA: MogA/MoaB family molybdenum cofactor biosynthesis protein [Anaerolineales bacterium]|nr:MogA/MoaB family molybdenum cofactor biosynthesis protein [Anaerolineales bacterium]